MQLFTRFTSYNINALSSWCSKAINYDSNNNERLKSKQAVVKFVKHYRDSSQETMLFFFFSKKHCNCAPKTDTNEKRSPWGMQRRMPQILLKYESFVLLQNLRTWQRMGECRIEGTLILHFWELKLGLAMTHVLSMRIRLQFWDKSELKSSLEIKSNNFSQGVTEYRNDNTLLRVFIVDNSRSNPFTWPTMRMWTL